MISVVFVAAAVILAWRFPGMAVPAAFYGFTAGAVGAFPQATLILVVLLVGILGIKSLARPLTLTVSAIDVCFFLFIGWCCISTAWQPNGGEAFSTATYFASNTIAIYLLFRLAGGMGEFRERVLEMAAGFCVFGTVLTPLALGSGIYNYGRLFVGNSTPVGLAQPVPYLLLSSLAMIVAVKRHRLLMSLVVLLPLSAAFAMGAGTGTRGALLAAGAGLIAFVALSGSLTSTMITIAALAALALVALVVTGQIAEIQRGLVDRLLDFGSYGGAQDLSSLARYEHYRFAWYLFEKNPIAGVGLGGYSTFTGLEYPHNLFLEVAAKTGAVGLVLLAVLLLAVISGTRAMLSVEERIPAAIFSAFLVVALVHQQVSFDLAQGKGIYLVGVLAGWQALGRKSHKPSKPPILAPVATR